MITVANNGNAHLEDTMTEIARTIEADPTYASAAAVGTIDRVAIALRGNGFTVEVVDTPEDARALVDSLLPDGTQVFTTSSETLRLSGIETDVTAGRLEALRPILYAMDYQTQRDEIRRLGSSPDVVIGSVHAVTESGSLVIASATGSQLGLYASGGGRVIYVVGAQKIVPDLDTALDRIERYSLPLEDARARAAYGQSSAVRKILVVNAEADPTRTTVVLVRTEIGY